MTPPGSRLLVSALCLLVPVPLLAGDMEPGSAVGLVLSIPFLLLLLSAALLPLLARAWWQRNYQYVAIGLGLIPVAYYLVVRNDTERLLHTAHEYVSFIALIGSLFVIAGGIHIRMRGRSTPRANLVLLCLGGLIANIVGTTGASMILIRPYIRVNRYRIKPYHVVFFIFVVSNMGGALTPIGDPPLFLGYLRGIPFFWIVEQVWEKWLVAMTLVLALFYAIDAFHFRRLSKQARHAAEETGEEGEVGGLQNLAFLLMVLVAVFITSPIFLREIIMVGAAVGSYLWTPKEIHRKNEFNFHPIREVALLFLGIFATMIPALQWLENNATTLGIRSVASFYWATGSLSAFLDNAPTYLNFLSAQIGLFVRQDSIAQIQHLVNTRGADVGVLAGPYADDVRNAFTVLLRYHFDHVAAGTVQAEEISTAYLIGNHSLHLQAISLAAVFFGACSYIGNGPNFMVKAIADHAGVETPSFFGYIVRYAIPILIPIFAIVMLLFFRA